MGHPYAPAELELPGFVPLQLSQGQILAPFLGTSLFVVVAVWLISGRCRGLSKTDRLLMCWWAFTGLTHIIIEGTFVFAPSFFKKENPNYFDEVWKEYSKGDSRYVARDVATVTVEGITAVLEGPASLLAVYDLLNIFSQTQNAFLDVYSTTIVIGSLIILFVSQHPVKTWCCNLIMPHSDHTTMGISSLFLIYRSTNIARGSLMLRLLCWYCVRLIFVSEHHPKN
ncbi:hypothetical protein HU200_021010 [Digitaria exilis]|uniref:EXPERA domain-containing protein n=1 Tax=Digitaria exilis TaxID=1010633 RepID=A0A835EZN8_9POAL|nr:hypothetical protein HU200_021010 [Digitaria exilis]